ncbi:MAG: DUF4139 domain-containing protein [Myxococcota bacterium]
MIEAATTIERVTVYSDAAQVRRRARLPSQNRGLVRVGFPDLPESLDPSALRVRSSAGLVRSVERAVFSVEREDRSGAQSERIRGVLEQLQEEELKIGAAAKAMREELGLIDRLVPAAPQILDGAPRIAPLRPDLFLRGLEVVQARRTATVAGLRESERALEILRARQRAGQRRLSLLGETDQSAAKRSLVGVLVEVPADGPLELELEYLVRWATWRPRYELRLHLEESRLECALLADVWQRSGEDWRGVALALSTTEAVAGLWLPAVEPWSIEAKQAYQDVASDLYHAASCDDDGVHAPPADEFAAYAAQFESEGEWAAVTAAGAMKQRMGWISADRESSEAPRARPTAPRRNRLGAVPLDHPEYEELSTTSTPYDCAGGFPFEHAIRSPASVPTGNQRARFMLGTSSWPIDLEYVLRPAVRATAFARAHCRNEADVPLLAGPAAIYVGHDRFGENRLASTPPAGAITVELGAETAIQSTRRSKTSLKSGGLFSKEEHHLVEVTIEVVSHLPTRASVLVEDQIPISADEKVKVSLGKTEPKNAELDPKTGRLGMRIPLGPGEKRTLSFEYLLHLPKDTEAEAHLEEVIA